MNKKNERRVLEFVYDLTHMKTVVETEEPDFLIYQHKTDKPFGVEVTEFYYSGASARLANIPDYFHELLHESKFRHREDKQVFEIHDMQIYTPDGEFKGDVRGILQRGFAIAECVELLTEAIRKKEVKTARYLAKCRHVNLVIFDTEQFLRHVPLENYFGLLYHKSLRDLLFETHFREIFLVTQVAGGRWIYIPLIMVLFISEVFKFQEILLGESLPPFETQCIIEQLDAFNNFNDLVPFFAAYLSRKTNRVFIHTIEQQLAIVFGNSSISMGDKTYNIYNQSDLPWPTSLRQETEQTYRWMFDAPDFRKRERMVEEEHQFSTQLVYDVAREVDFIDVSESEEISIE